MKSLLLILFVFALAACTPSMQNKQSNENLIPEEETTMKTAIPKSTYPDLGPAPELAGDVWLNSNTPLTISELHGKVVLVEMWAFGCINCRNVIPSLRGWYQKYSGHGLVIIGNHFPEFSNERDLNNLKQAIVDLNVPYPVVQDNDGTNWNAYNNHFWPTIYLIDKQGHIRYTHIGEGAYAETETAIQALLNAPDQE